MGQTLFKAGHTLSAAGLVLLGACAIDRPVTAGPSVEPTLGPPVFNVMATVPGEVYVCPQGPAGTYTYSVTSSVQAAWSHPPYSGTFTAAEIAAAEANDAIVASPVFTAGTCTLVFEINASIDHDRGDGVTIDAVRSVTIQQTSAPGGTQLDQIVTTVANGPDVITLPPATTVAVSLNDFHGAVAAFWNSLSSSGCTLTIGYWKTHAGLGSGNQKDQVTSKLPIWLGTAGGPKSVQVTTNVQAVAILGYDDTSSNGILKLMGQLLGAKLNLKTGVDGSAIAPTITSADNFLALNSASDWWSLSAEQQSFVLALKTTLDNWNNGVLGPSGCD